MTINTKYSIGDIVYSMYDNKVICEHITSIITETVKDHKGNLVTEIKYKTNNSRYIKEDKVFYTKENLLKTL